MSGQNERAVFRPQFTLGLLYAVAIFFLYCLLLVMPELLDVMRSVPPGPAQEEAAREAAYEATRRRLPWALVATILTLIVAAYTRALPGMRGGR